MMFLGTCAREYRIVKKVWNMGSKSSILLAFVVSVLLSSSAVLVFDNITTDDDSVGYAAEIIDIETNQWTRGSSSGFVVTFDSNISEFVKAELEFTPLGLITPLNEGEHFTLTPGSTVFTLLPSYLNTLDAGEYELRIKFVGDSWIPITIKEPTDTFGLDDLGINPLFLIVIVVMILAGSGVIYLFKR
jgi:hypothetical protein